MCFNNQYIEIDMSDIPSQIQISKYWLNFIKKENRINQYLNNT